MDFDVLVVGSGAGGGMAALRLCESGLKVGLLERGPQFDHRKDFILNYSDWDTRPNPLEQAKTKEQTIDLAYRTPVSEGGRTYARAALGYHRVHGLGGSTLHYQGEAHRFGEHAFKLNREFGWGVDWPLQYTDLAPYYKKAETLLGVAGEVGNPFKPKRGAFPTPAHSLSPRSQILAKSAQQVGTSLLPNTLALPSKSTDGRTPCQHSGGCNFGCVFGAKSSVDQAIIPRALATGNLTILTRTRVTRLNLDHTGAIESLLCVDSDTDKKFKLSAKRYVLAMGAVETPRLMLASAGANADQGYANLHDQVGRYFMETVTTRLSLELSADIRTYLGPPLDSRIWDFYRPIDELTNGFVLGSAGYLYPSTSPSRHAISTPGIGRAHKLKTRATFGRKLYLFGIAEQEPMPDNRITLSSELDAMQVPKVNVHCEYSDRDLHTIAVMHGKLRDWADATPTKSIGRGFDTRYRSAATHVAGSCRMGDNPVTSVVDAYGKVHSQKNCYIADGSVMPTQGAGDSPSLTIQALALRTADKLAADFTHT